MKKEKMRRSDNIQDLRDPLIAARHNWATGVGLDVDEAIIQQHTARILGTPKDRKVEKELTYLLDAMGEKGKGRIGGGRANRVRFERAMKAAMWRFPDQTKGKKK